MTDTGQVPGEGLPESAGMVEQPGAPAHGAYTYLSETTAETEDEDLLLPGAQGAWGNEVPPPAPEPVVETVHQPGPHEISGRDSGSVDLGGVRLPDPPPIPPITPRRPLHLGPPLPDSSTSPVRSLADRGPADAPVRQPAPSPAGPEYLDGPRASETPSAPAAPWGAQVTHPAPVSAGAAPAETVVPATEPMGTAQAVPTHTTTHTAPPVAAGEDPATAQHQTPAEAGQAAPAAVAADAGAMDADPARNQADATAEQAVPAGAGGGAAQAAVAPEAALPPVVADAGQDAGVPGPDSAGEQAAVADAAEQTVASAPAPENGQTPAAVPFPKAASGPEHAAVTSPETVGTETAAQAPDGSAEAVAPEAVAQVPAAGAAPEAAAPHAETATAAAVAQTPAADVAPEAAAPLPDAVVPEAVAQAPIPNGETEVAAPAADAAAAPQAAAPLPDAVVQVPTASAEPAAAAPAAAPAADVTAAPQAAAPLPDLATPEAAAQAPTPSAGPAAAAPAAEATAAPQAAAPLPDLATPEAAAQAPTPGAEPAAAAPAADATAAPQAAAPLPEAPAPEAAPQVPAPGVEPEAPAAVVPTSAPEAVAHVPAAGVDPEAAAPGEDASAPEAAAPAVAPSAPEAAAPAVAVNTPEAVARPLDVAAPEPPAPAPEAIAPEIPAPEHVPAQEAAPEPPVAPAAPQPQATDSQATDPQPAALTPEAPGQHATAAPAPDAPAAATALPGTAVPAEAPHPAAAQDAPAPAQPSAAAAPEEAPAPLAAPDADAVPADAPDAVTVTPAAEPATPAPAEDVTVVLPAPVAAPVADESAGQPVQGPQQSLPAPSETLEPSAPMTTVPAPRDGDAELAQNADDLDTRAAEQEDLADQERREESAVAVAEARRSTGPAAPGYDPAEREAVLKVMRERRDIRNGFRSDPIPHEVLLRVLEAAHHAPSVGHSQPWDFVVIRSADTRRAMHELAMRQRDAYAKSLPKGRAKQFKELKIEAILDTPVNIVVTADPTRGGRHTLGRHTQPQMAPYSAALAVENLWLAARAEGLGVGWVSFFDEREMVRALGLPEHLEIIAYLCVGYVDEFPDEPELLQAGWSKRRPLSWVVHEETYGRRALPGEEPHDLLAETVAQIRPLDAKALGEAWERQKRMTKPAGALGMLEIISAQLSGLSRQCPPPIPEPAAVAVFAGDHGVHAQGVTPWPQEVTAQMVANFLGGGAVCNAFATQVGAEVCIVDVGVAADLPATPGLLPRKIRGGTSDMTTGPAMTREEARQAIEVGIETARDLVAAGNKALLTGEMGIGNTTASAALISVFTGADPAEVTGRGTGINDETLARKTEVVRRALELHQPDPADPVGVLAAIGGFEHAAIVGLLLGGASLRTPVILDGVSAGAAALVARAIAPEVLAACIAGHRSAEPGHVAALNKLGLRPLVDLDLRLGEGTGALLALPLVQSTARAMHEVATFDSAGVTEK
ncbi:nicotinate-nucleotide--dimethylbenzimidazole phosphoribosyltransferase [Streptomyces sp. NPDC050698]